MTKIEWSVTVFDKPNVDRLPVRKEHVANIPKTIESGTVTSVGAIYHDVDKTKFAGSTYHIMAESKEEILDFLRQDVYYKHGIWDLSSVIAHPVGIVNRQPKDLLGVKM